jgi:hypothetical protein
MTGSGSCRPRFRPAIRVTSCLRWPGPVSARHPWPQPRPGCRQWMVTVGAGCCTVRVMVGPGRVTVTVMAGCGAGTLTVTVTVGVGLPLCRELVAPRTAGTMITTISAMPNAATAVSKPFASKRFCAFLRWLLPGRGACGVVTPLMVSPGCPAHERYCERLARGIQGCLMTPGALAAEPPQPSFATADSPSCWPDTSCAATAK